MMDGTPDRAPRIGIVVPAHRQPMLCDEALRSALEQGDASPAPIVVVDDGCPFPETAEGLRAMAMAEPGRIHVLRRRNGGLSAARNTGATYLLQRYPSLEALFFLDADNLLAPGALATFERLLDARPEPDWFYPQFDMFGLAHSASNCGPYSLLMHTADNMCEAGSLVRRRVFDAGVRYDEGMRLGYEDWDFWLSAAARGFRGEPVDAPVFLYRKRPESMLSGSHRHDAELRGYLRRKHGWLYNPRTILALEQAEAPRYRFLREDGGAVAATDPLDPHPAMDAEAFAREAWAWIASGGERDAGAFWIVATAPAWAALQEAGLLRFALWDLERRLAGADVATLLLEPGGEDGFAIASAGTVPAPHLRAGVAAVGATLVGQMLRDPGDLWLRQLDELQPPQSFSHCRLALPVDAPAAAARGGAVTGLREAIGRLRRHRFRDGALRPATWRTRFFPPRAELHRLARQAAGVGVMLPSPGGASRNRICFLLTTAEFGGVETVSANIAAVFRDSGFHVALCVVGAAPIRLPRFLRQAFDEFLWYPEASATSWSDRRYAGTYLHAPLSPAAEADALGLLAGFDCVIGCHAGGAVGAFGALRQRGVVTVLHEHILDTTAYARTNGSPAVALAYEAALDLIATCSQGLADWLHGQGVPADKLVVAPNAPGYPMGAQDRAAIMDRRAGDRGDRPLRALFIGRFDAQKGLDRLVEIIERLRAAEAPVEWRVVGRAVVEAAEDDLRRLGRLATIEPAVSTPRERTALYAWADVVVLPSRYEGMPLTVLEAQRCGAAPVVAGSGAVEEAVANGVDGFVVSQEDCVAQTVRLLADFARRREGLSAISRAGAAKTADWPDAARALVGRVQAEIALKRAGCVATPPPAPG